LSNSSNISEIFISECIERVAKQAGDTSFQELKNNFLLKAVEYKYPYNFKFLGRPIIQFPQDMVAIQELIWRTKPDLIIETGIAHGGSLIMSAAMLALLDLCETTQCDDNLSNQGPKRLALGIDIDIRDHNRIQIEAHPLASKIKMIEGSSIDPAVVERVNILAKEFKNILVILDSNHTHDHVLAELYAYTPLVNLGSYCLVLDTVIDDLPPELFPNRPWGPGNSPRTAVREFIEKNSQFEIEESIENTLMITGAPSGYLKRIRK
jgi:cephalosporin hydroxylase